MPALDSHHAVFSPVPLCVPQIHPVNVVRFQICSPPQAEPPACAPCSQALLSGIGALEIGHASTPGGTNFAEIAATVVAASVVVALVVVSALVVVLVVALVVALVA